MISDELVLMLAIVALYLYDSTLFLSTNEAVLSRASAGRWIAFFGSQNYRVGGREPFVPNPFTPHRRLYKMSWSMEAESASGPVALTLDAQQSLDALWPWVYCLVLSLFVLMPLGLFTRLGLGCTLAAVGLFYATVLSLCAVVCLNRQRFAITSRQAASIAFQCLACPPFAVNVVRKICASKQIDADFVHAAREILRATDLQRANAQCLLRLDEQIDLEPEGTPRSFALRRARIRFESD